MANLSVLLPYEDLSESSPQNSADESPEKPRFLLDLAAEVGDNNNDGMQFSKSRNEGVVEADERIMGGREGETRDPRLNLRRDSGGI